MDQDHFAPADGAHTTNGTPHGFSTITPFLALGDPAGAIAFYRDVLVARVVTTAEFGGTIAHAELAFANGRLQLGAASPDYGLVAPDPARDDASASFGIYVPNVDEVVAKAIERGAVLREATASFVSGDRYANLRDPFGVRWTVMTRIEDLSDEESAARVDAWMAEQAAPQGGDGARDPRVPSA